MAVAEFAALDTDGKVKFLNDAHEAGADFDACLEKAGVTRIELTTMGIFFVMDKFLPKPIVENGYLTRTDSKEA